MHNKKSIIIFFWFFLMACQKDEAILNNLSENDANEVLLALFSQNIKAEKKLNHNKKIATYSILVKKNEIDKSLKILIKNQIPKNIRSSIKDIFPPGSHGLIPTKAEEIAKVTLASQGEIENLLKSIPGVIEAKVVLSLGPVLEIFSRESQKKSASVVLVINKDETFLSEFEIKSLVAASVLGLDPSDVTVVTKYYIPPDYLKLFDDKEKIAIKNQSNNGYLWPLLALSLIGITVGLYGIFRVRIIGRGLSLITKESK